MKIQQTSTCPELTTRTRKNKQQRGKYFKVYKKNVKMW